MKRYLNAVLPAAAIILSVAGADAAQGHRTADEIRVGYARDLGAHPYTGYGGGPIYRGCPPNGRVRDPRANPECGRYDDLGPCGVKRCQPEERR